MVTKEKKRDLVEKFGRHKDDAGSASVQVAVLTERINTLASHFAKNPKDHASRRGLIMMVAQRRGLLSYIRRKDPKEYSKVIRELDLRK
ncbi:MAG TPA: 30S ribosomal protein S15 [Elusimicrobiota bacterium]|nr:30S ribosomal protein S15 [Elusimicrobiota bacterium]